MSIVERLQGKVKELREVAEKLADIQAERDLNAEEQKQYDDTIAELKAVQVRLEKAIDDERVLLKTAQPLQLNQPNAPPAVHLPKTENEPLEKGLLMAAYARCMLVAKGDAGRAHDLCARHYPKQANLASYLKGLAMGELPKMSEITRAAVAPGTTTDATYASALVTARTLSSEFIELLRPQTILGQISGFTRVPFNVKIARQTAPLTANWVGEAQPKPVSRPGFDFVTMPWAKVVIITAFSDELYRFSDPSVDLLIRDDMVRTTAQFLDDAFINYANTAAAGINPAPVTGDGAGTAVNEVPSTGASVDQITSDANSAIMVLAGANVPMRNPYWIMSTRTYNTLMTLRTVQGVFAFRDELVQGRWFGFPVIHSTAVPTNIDNGTTATDSFIALMDASQVLYAADDGIDISMSDQAALQLNDAPTAGASQLTSLWQNNLIGMKSERYIYWMLRNDEAVAVITGVTY